MDGTRGARPLTARPVPRPACRAGGGHPDCDAAAVLGIFRARAGRYRSQDPGTGGAAAADGLELEIAEAAGASAVVAMVSRHPGPGPDAEERLETAVIQVDDGCSVSMVRPPGTGSTGAGPRRLALRVREVDAVRRAQIVFGYGDIEGDEPSEEVVFHFRHDGGVTYVHAWGVPGDPYAPRVRREWSPSR